MDSISKYIILIRGTLLICIFLFIYSCNDSTSFLNQNKKGLDENLMKEKPDTVCVEGKFVKIKLIGNHYYNLWLKNEKDSIVKFLTMMPIGATEIKFLKDSGNNIYLCYETLYNPVRNEYDKLVRSMTPIYDFRKR